MKNKNVINVLEPAIFNLLAAGEVVENPSSIVKEVVENSLDAGATQIVIAIKGGGIDEIIVTDNGCGIAESELPKVFLPHATSKIATAKDLERIGTLGFRGEALSSISSVSKAEIVTRTNDCAMGSVLVDGKISKTSANVGTTITIRNLFYNVPARKKFLQNTSREQNNVTDVVQKLILANPEIAFKYVIDGEVYYDYRGKNLMDAIGLVYHKDDVTDLLAVDARRRDFKLHGYISRPSQHKKNKTRQIVMVNGRAVEGGVVARAVNDAYSNYLGTGCFPIFVLRLDVDEAEVDVNVHPRKAQVKFSAEAEIFAFVRSAVTGTIDSFFHQGELISSFDAIGRSRDRDATVEILPNDKQVLDNIKFLTSSGTEKGIRVRVGAPRVLNLLQKEHQRKVERAQSATQERMEEIESVDVKIFGNLFDTYILLVKDDRFCMIDQHAAQERLLFDELSKQIDSGVVATQMLVEPSIVYLTPAEMNQMESIAPELNKMGIECEVFGGNCFRVTAVPVSVSERGIDTVISNVLKQTKNVPVGGLSTLLREKLITECCRSSIKAGQGLSNAQIMYFLEQFGKKGMTPLCPHGRPVILSYTKSEIEKMFARRK